MKLSKKLLSLLLCAVMVLGSVAIGGGGFAEVLDAFSVKASAASSGKCGTNVAWTLSDDGVLTISGTGNMKDYSRSSDTPWYSSRKSIKTVVIENGVTSIGDCAFEYCDCLTSITMPNSVTSIGKYAFEDCTHLTSITIPDSVTSIGKYAFEDCTHLTSITIPDSVTSIGEHAFQDCTGLTSVTIGNSVTSIDVDTFAHCKSLASITIPDSVTSIGDWAFFDCASLLSVTIPYSVTSIGEDAFNYCTGLTSINIPDGVTNIGDGAFNKVNNISYSYNMKASGSPWNAKCANGYVDGSLVYTDSAKKKLCGCSSLTSGAISIPNSVKIIGNYAFEDCAGLTSITIPDGVTSIGISAFEDCAGLTSIVIPDGVTSIDYRVFRGCTSLTSATISDSVTSISYMAFYDCSCLTSITIPDSVISIGNYAFDNCTGLTSITIPDSVTSIGDDAFCGCTGLTSITIPDSVTSIGDDAFCGCTGLTSITIPNSVTSIGFYAFCNCIGLTSITIPNSVPIIGDSTFYNCTGLTSITIPNSVKSIGNYAFRNCTGLTSVTIGNGVASIGNFAFNGCTSLKDVFYSGSESDRENIIFGNYNSILLDANWHYNCYPSADYPTESPIEYFIYEIKDGEAFVKYYIGDELEVVIPQFIEGCPVTSLSGTFNFGPTDDCDNTDNIKKITRVTIPASVSCISSASFNNCQSLMTIYYYGCTAQWNIAISGFRRSPYTRKSAFDSNQELTNAMDNLENADVICLGIDNSEMGFLKDYNFLADSYSFYNLEGSPSMDCLCELYGNAAGTFIAHTNIAHRLIDGTPHMCYGQATTTAYLLKNGISKVSNNVIVNQFGYNPEKIREILPTDKIDIHTRDKYGFEISDFIKYAFALQYYSKLTNQSNKIYADKNYNDIFLAVKNYINGGNPVVVNIRRQEGAFASSEDGNYQHTVLPVGWKKTHTGYDVYVNNPNSPNSLSNTGSNNTFTILRFKANNNIITGWEWIEDGRVKACESNADISYNNSEEFLEYLFNYGVLDGNNINTETLCSVSGAKVTKVGNKTVDTTVNDGFIDSVYMPLTSLGDGDSTTASNNLVWIDSTVGTIEVSNAELNNNIIFASGNHTIEFSLSSNDEAYITVDDTGEKQLIINTNNGNHFNYVSKYYDETGREHEIKIDGIAGTDQMTLSQVDDIVLISGESNLKIERLVENEVVSDEEITVNDEQAIVKYDESKNNVTLNVASTQTIDYRSIVTITATATGVPDDCKLAIYLGSQKVAEGNNKSVSYEYGEIKSDINYTVKVIDANGKVQKDSNGNELSKDGGKITCNAGFFKKLIAFFKGLFKSLPKVEVKP